MTAQTVYATERIYINNSNLQGVIDTLKAAKEKYGDSATLDIEIEYDSIVTSICYPRPETAAETKHREFREAQSKACRRLQYEQMKKEFEQ